MSSQASTTRPNLDDLVSRYVDLQAQIADLTDALEGVKSQLRDLGPGEHRTSNGAAVVVSPPPRRFNLTAAWSLLTEEQRAVAVAPDPKKVKAQLPEVLIDQCMDPGTGAARVSVKA